MNCEVQRAVFGFRGAEKSSLAKTCVVEMVLHTLEVIRTVLICGLPPANLSENLRDQVKQE